jgi:universal stress protein A
MKLKTRNSRRNLLNSTAEEWSPRPIRVGELKPKMILAPVDFTECSQKAVTYAVSLAKHFHSKIVLLHVSTIGTPTPSAEMVALQGDLLIKETMAAAARQLSRWRDRVVEHVPARALVINGVSIQDEIVAAAHETNCDLIVMATHARGALAHLFTGSVTEKVVHHAPCPVFVVREREHDFIQTRSRTRHALSTAA